MYTWWVSRSDSAPVRRSEPNNLGPLVEGQFGGHQDGAPLVELAKDREGQFRAGAGQGDEAQSMISRLSQESCFWRLGVCLSSLTSISSWTKVAAVVNLTDLPL